MSTKNEIEASKGDYKTTTEINTHFLNHYEKIKKFTDKIDENHEIFWLKKNRIQSLENISYSSLKNLKLIYLGNNEIKNINVNNFKAYENLKVLSLANNQIEYLEPDSFKDLKLLQFVDLSHNEITEIDSKLFAENKELEMLSLRKNRIKNIQDEAFKSLKNLILLYLGNNAITKINSNIFRENENLKMLSLVDNLIEHVENDAFKSLNKLEELYLDDNKMKKISTEIFKQNSMLKILSLKNNRIESIEKEAFKFLRNVKLLYLHPLHFFPTTNIFRDSLISSITFFDEKIFKKPDFKCYNQEINRANVAIFCGRTFTSNSNVKSEYFLINNSLSSIKLNAKFKCYQEDFIWDNIPFKLAIVIGKNSSGKTTLLKLIDESMNSGQDYSHLFITKFNNCSDEKLMNCMLHGFCNKKNSALFKVKSNRETFSNLLYDLISEFSVVQYFDYLLLIGCFSDYDQNILKYKLTNLKERRFQQDNFLNNVESQEYYDGIKSIEYYLGLNDDHKLSPGENLFILIELLRLHGKHSKTKNEKENRFISCKLRILLLDEPDSHMHPSLIKDFIELLSSNHLDHLNLQVIMTTHNPITVSFIPPFYQANIFELIVDQNNKRLIKNAENRSQMIFKTSDDLFYIKKKCKIVFIEGSIGDDEAFYNCVFSLFIQQKSENLLNIKRNEMIRFQEMGDKEFNRIFKLNDEEKNQEYLRPNVDELIFGINDGDFNIYDAYKHFNMSEYEIRRNIKSPISDFNQEIFQRLSRYNIENYVYDPINILFAINYLLNENNIPVESLKKKSTNCYFNKIVEYLNIFKEKKWKNCLTISQFLDNDKEDAIQYFEKILTELNEFYIYEFEKIVISKEKNKEQTEFVSVNPVEFSTNDLSDSKPENIDMFNSKNNNKQNSWYMELTMFKLEDFHKIDSKKNNLKKKIPVEIKVGQIEFTLNYYPIFLYFNGKKLYENFMAQDMNSIFELIFKAMSRDFYHQRTIDTNSDKISFKKKDAKRLLIETLSKSGFLLDLHLEGIMQAIVKNLLK